MSIHVNIKKEMSEGGSKVFKLLCHSAIRTTQSPNPIQLKSDKSGPTVHHPYQSWNKHVLHVIGADTFFNSRSSPRGGVSPPDWSARVIEFGLVWSWGLWRAMKNIPYVVKKKCPVKIGWEWKLIKRGDREATEAWPQTDNGPDL